jgi:hypothetical protein
VENSLTQNKIYNYNGKYFLSNISETVHTRLKSIVLLTLCGLSIFYSNEVASVFYKKVNFEKDMYIG